MQHYASCLLLFLTLAGCSAPDLPPVDPDLPPADQAVLTRNGPFPFATRDFMLVDRARKTPQNGTYAGSAERRLATRVWYPVADGAGPAQPPPPPRSGGPYPIIAYAHGFFSQNGDARHFAEHLASHGYVVAAPTFPLSSGGAPGGPTIADLGEQPGDLRFVLSSLAALPSDPLAAAIDSSRQGLLGLSLGGGTVLLAAYHPILQLANVAAVVAHAPLSCFFGAALYSRPLPGLLIGGDADELVPFATGPARAFGRARPPLTLLRLRGGNHVGFVNLDLPGIGNADSIGCGVIKLSDPSKAYDAVYAALTQGTSPEVIQIDQCKTDVCTLTFRQSMRAARQLDLARAATLAHFEAVLRHRPDAARFLAERLGPDNPDTEVEQKLAP